MLTLDTDIASCQPQPTRRTRNSHIVTKAMRHSGVLVVEEECVCVCVRVGACWCVSCVLCELVCVLLSVVECC